MTPFEAVLATFKASREALDKLHANAPDDDERRLCTTYSWAERAVMLSPAGTLEDVSEKLRLIHEREGVSEPDLTQWAGALLADVERIKAAQ